MPAVEVAAEIADAVVRKGVDSNFVSKRFGLWLPDRRELE
jgi:hypothetical protein